MSQGVTFDITARVTGYEQGIKALREALAKLDPGADIAKSIKRALESAESQVKSVGKNLTPQITNENQLDRLTAKLNNAGSAIQQVGELFKNVTANDINFSAVDSSIDQLKSQLQQLQTQLANEVSVALRDTITNSQDLSDTFKNLNLDITDKSVGQIFEDLAKKAQEASEATKQAEKELENAQVNFVNKELSLNKTKASPIVIDKDKIETDLRDITQEYNTFKEKIVEGMKGLKVDKSKADEFATNFLGGLTPQNVKDKVLELKDAVSKALGDSKTAAEIYQGIFGKETVKGANNAPAVAASIRKMLPDMETLKKEFEQKISEISGDLSKGNLSKITSLISKEDFENALKTSVEIVEKVYNELQGKILQQQQALAEATQQRDSAQIKLTNAETQENKLKDTITLLTQKVENLTKANTELTTKIKELETKVQQNEQKGVETLRKAGDDANKAADNFKVTTSEVNRYSAALEKVKQREQLVGKIEGIVQRWFSIYAAVRMVSNAIKSMISTVKELDKTITEIAIVTDMSQNDLWKQMPQYTAMAKEYAVSIGGVYKVSQLFYQQGLQTNDVMRLSAETLKLARIAGIDYGDAANYMTNAIRSFKLEMEDASKVTDVYSALAASSAVTVSELAEAMSKTASSANSVGSSLENTSAMIAVMTEATRESASNIGSALKSIISRYGEMKASPRDILSVDGEEASFNKVDTALKSIGISLKDAQGQFRNFDDVIMELASVWDTLDNNTQRYIATIMAGNRQQSRFIALVSSYDRLKELTGIAAESEDAAQQQFLKTLDSIEAKTQQLQTSLQNLYTSAGLEDLYKGLLDIGANVLNYYNSISNTIGGGISGALTAVASFGAQFYNLANIVLKVLRLVKTYYINNQKQLDLLSSAHAKLRANETLSQEERMALRSRGIYLKAEQDKTEIHEIEERKRAKITAKLDAEAAAIKRRQATGNTLYGIGTVGSIVGTTIGGNLGAGISVAGSAIGAIGAFMTPGGWLAGIMSVISAVTSLISLFPSLSKKIEEANQKLTELRNVESQTKSEQKELESAIKQEEELRKVRYRSAEDAEAYQEALNNLAEIAPALITGYNEAGDAILDITRAEDVLARAREKTRKLNKGDYGFDIEYSYERVTVI